MRAFLLTELIRRDLSSRFAGSFGGPFWAVLHPLIQCLLYSVVFSVFLKVRPPAGFEGGYVEFLLAGLLPWIGFQEALQRGTVAVTDQAHLVKKLKFPLHLLVLSSVGSALLLQLLAFGVFVVYSVASGVGSPRPLTLLAAFVFEALLLLGPVLVLATLNVFFRDTAHLLPPVLMILFYLTPVLYPEEVVPKSVAPWLAVNPLREMVALFRAGLFSTRPPDPFRLVAWTALLLVLAFAARRLFRRCESSFSDLL